MARKKKTDVYELHRQQYWQQHGWASYMRDRYPDISLITIDLEFKDADVWPGDPKARQLRFRPDQKAFFKMECPYHECVRGGFDFSEGVKAAIESPSGESSGSVVCQGWQDQERINRHRCLLTANYKVVVSRA